MIGRTISHYKILEKIGEGGMGVVYKAEDTKLRRTVALKFLPSELTQDAEAKQRFLHEARAAAALNHANIVTVYEINEHEGQTYIAMEYIEGRTLKEITHGPLPLAQVLDIAQQIARGLAAAHAKGIVHRDIKPANIFITSDNTVKILDFGIAKLAGGETKLTKTGTTMGTAAYMSPEQTTGKEVDQRTDIWSLGVILYEMLAGETPFKGEYMQAVVYAILNEEPKPLAKIRPDMPVGLESVIGRALAKNPKDRYQSMNDLAANLKAAVEGTQLIKAGTKGFWANIFSKKTIYLSTTAAALAVLLALDIGGIRGRLFGPRGGAPGIVRLAVLPFANLSGDPQQEYFSDGLTQEMISQLGRLHPQSLSVIARSSVLRYKKTNTPIDQVGRELNVGYVLEGSVQREGTRVRITAELIKVRDQSQLWSDSMEREMAGILALQSDVARKVAEALALKLLPSERTRLAATHTVNSEAYDAYLKGSQYWTRLTPADLDTAERYLDLALEKDPTFAQAHAGLALVWILRQQMGFAPPSKASPKAKEAARKAVELDDTVADAHVTLAIVLTWTDWNFAAARGEWARALELDPSNSQARAFYAHYLLAMGRHDEAMAQIEAALKGDPFNGMIRTLYSGDLMWTGRYEEALTAARDVLRLQPDEPAAVNVVWLTSARLGRQKEAIKAAREYVVAIYQDPNVGRTCDEGYAQGGYTEAMRRVAEALAARFRTSFAVTTDVAAYYLEAGDKARALDWLEKGYEVRDPSMPVIGMGPFFDALRSEPRYQALLKRMNLPSGENR